MENNYVLILRENCEYIFGKRWGYGLRCRIEDNDTETKVRVFFPFELPDDPRHHVEKMPSKEVFTTKLIQYLLKNKKKVILENNGLTFYKGESEARIVYRIQQKGF